MDLLEAAQPTTLAHLAGLDSLKRDVQSWLDNDSWPQALLFRGPPGTGKTSAAYVIARTVLGEHHNSVNFIESNASDDRGISYIRDELKFAMRSKPLGVPRKVILLDEADGLTTQAQDAMRQLIEKYSKNAMLILTCNEMEKIRPAIRSRCSIYPFSPVSPEAGAERLGRVLVPAWEKTECEEIYGALLRKLVELMNGDLRACIMFLDSIDLADIEERVDMLEAITEDNSALLATQGDWHKLRLNLRGLLRAGKSLNQVLFGFYRNIYQHFDDEDVLENIWDVMSVYGDVMTHRHTWAGDDYSYCDYMVAKMKKEVKTNE
jgi:replication factor C small subunit|tara:strand:+ start:379 stop:1338 length:960 start_codon:yes stop_codon:yes gene_type:complete